MNNKSTSINHNHIIQLSVVIMFAVAISACSSITRSGENQDPGSTAGGQEESGTQLTLNETYDHVRNGA